MTFAKRGGYQPSLPPTNAVPPGERAPLPPPGPTGVQPPKHMAATFDVAAVMREHARLAVREALVTLRSLILSEMHDMEDGDLRNGMSRAAVIADQFEIERCGGDGN